MTLHTEVNPFSEATWQNHPPPSSFPDFERELRAIGGTHLNGSPFLRLAWAPNRKKMRLGKMRHIYRDTRIPVRRVECSFGYRVKRVGDSDEAWQLITPERLGEFGSEFLVVPNMETEVVAVAWQRWVVEQYFPPERLEDTPQSWEARRFRRFTPPETNVETFGDCIGPFPSEGEYRLLLVIQSTRLAPFFDEAAAYRAPDRDVLDTVRDLMAVRERHHEALTLEERIARDYKEAADAEAKREEELSRRLDDELKPYERRAEGNAFVAVPNAD